jgi:hypothetical protein
MMKSDKIEFLPLVLLLLLMFSFAGCEKIGTVSYGMGTLKGKIDIGPICPVETIPPAPGCLPTAETYKAYPVSVWTTDMNHRIADIKPALDGSYSTLVPDGKYIVVLNKQLAGPAGTNLPATIVIRDGTVTVLDINIDTGIR